MTKIVIPIFCFLSLCSSFAFSTEKDFEICGAGQLVIRTEGILPTNKERANFIPCKKLEGSDFLKIFKIISSAQIKKIDSYIENYRLILKTGSFNIYVDNDYIVELNNVHYEFIDRKDRLLLCTIVGQISQFNKDEKVIENFCLHRNPL